MNDKATPVVEAFRDEIRADGAPPPKPTEKAMIETESPPGALTWTSAKERNRRLKLWRRAVCAIFGEQPRAIRIAWALGDLFSLKTGYAFPSNSFLAEQTSIALNKVTTTLSILESGRAIIRRNVTTATGQDQRIIYAASAIIPRPALGDGGRSPTLGERGEPQEPGDQNLIRKIRRIQGSPLALARADSARRDQRRRHGGGPISASEPPASGAASQDGYPRSEASRDSRPSFEQKVSGMSIERAAGDRPRDAGGGIAVDRADDPDVRMRTPKQQEEEDEEEGEWTL